MRQGKGQEGEEGGCRTKGSAHNVVLVYIGACTVHLFRRTIRVSRWGHEHGAGDMRMDLHRHICFLWIHVPHEACLNEASVSGGHASAAQALPQVAKAELLFHTSAIWRLLHEVMDVAEVKVRSI